MVPVTLPVPGVMPRSDDAGGRSHAFAIRVDATVNLLEERELLGMQRAERLTKALAEQQAFLNTLLDPSLLCAFDLRLIARPGEPVPVDVVLLGRTWAASSIGSVDQEARSEALVRQIHTRMPRHITASIIEDHDEVLDLLQPFGRTSAVDTAVICKRELLGFPGRPDAQVSSYFSVVPFNWAQSDWTSLFGTLAAVPMRVVLSVGLLPVQLPLTFTQKLVDWATFFGRLAKEDQREGSLYFGRQKLPPDAFAVEAERTYQDFARRYERRRVRPANPGRRRRRPAARLRRVVCRDRLADG